MLLFLEMHNMTVSIKIISLGISNTSSSEILFRTDFYFSTYRQLLSACLLTENYF